MRTPRRIAAVTFATVLLAPPAVAKEGVRAKLDGSVRLGAAAGSKISVTWRLVHADGSAFGASGIYLRVSRCDGGAHRVNARALGGGRYSARATVPKGGIRMLRVGLEGWRTIGETTTRADAYFAFDPPLKRSCG